MTKEYAIYLVKNNLVSEEVKDDVVAALEGREEESYYDSDSYDDDGWYSSGC